MRIVLSAHGWDDYLWWQRQDRTTMRRVNQLIQDIARDGNDGIGQPEPLKDEFQGYWSRRVSDEHRLVHKVVEDKVRVAPCRYHYERWVSVGQSRSASRLVGHDRGTTHAYVPHGSAALTRLPHGGSGPGPMR